jgi:RimJ/RimL family protein N-acetyltransferase
MHMGGWRFTRLGFTIDPLAADAQRDAILAELLRMLVPWLIEERHVMTIGVSTLDNQPLVEQAVADLGGRNASRLRERFLVDGKRRDEHYVQFFNPDWIEKLGVPPDVAEELVDRAVRSPATRRRSIAGRDRLPTAVGVGDRVYLRAHVEGDFRRIAEWSMRETEDIFPEGRWVASAGAIGSSVRSIASTEPAEVIGLAVALREDDELIGVMVLFGIDWVHRTAETASEMFRPEYRGGGYGTEAKHLMLELAFDQLGLHMVYSSVSESNPRSAAALRKQGYRLGGYTAWESFVAGGLCGNWAYDLLADEWRAARDQHMEGRT